MSGDRKYLPPGVRNEIWRISNIVSLCSYRDGAYLFEAGRKGYEKYIGYARSESKKELYRFASKKSTGLKSSLQKFTNSKRSAVEQLRAIEKNSYDKLSLAKYSKRLTTKCAVTFYIARMLSEKFNLKLKVFDSPEYSIGAEILLRHRYITEKQHRYGFSFVDLSMANKVREAEKDFFHSDEMLVEKGLVATFKTELYEGLKTTYLNREQFTPAELLDASLRSSRGQHSVTHHNELMSASLQSLGWILLSHGILYSTESALFSILPLIVSLVATVKSRKNREKSNWEKNPVEAFSIKANEYSQKLHAREHYTKWYLWLNEIFSGSAGIDHRWLVSQRYMGEWLDSNIYLPWYENPRTV